MTHTPAPWKIDETKKIYKPCIRHNGIVVCLLLEAQLGVEVEEAEANAKLIAAAPELLEALKGLLFSVRGIVYKEKPTHYNARVAFYTAEDAIQKAEG